MIKIEKDKILFRGYEYKLQEIDNTDLPYHLSCSIEFGEGVTLERLLNIVIENKDIFNIIFSSHMGGYLIDYYIDEFNKDADEDNEWVDEMSHCEVYGVFNHMVYKKGDEDNSIYYSFHGKGKKPDETSYGFMGSSLNNYKHLPIKVDKHIEFVKDTGGRLHGKNAVTFEEKFQKIHEGDFDITVFDFIGAILHEISFMGKPEDRKKEFDKLDEISKRIDAGEEEVYEMLHDENGDAYFIKEGDEDGERNYIFGKSEDDDE